MTLYDHIQQLRAELAVSLDGAETQRMKTELQAAEAEQVKLDAVFDAWLAALE